MISCDHNMSEVHRIFTRSDQDMLLKDARKRFKALCGAKHDVRQDMTVMYKVVIGRSQDRRLYRTSVREGFAQLARNCAKHVSIL